MTKKNMMKAASFAAMALLVAVSGCDTIERARTAQKAVAVATNDVPAAVSKPLPRVNLLGAKFIDFVEFAMTNRRSRPRGSRCPTPRSP